MIRLATLLATAALVLCSRLGFNASEGAAPPAATPSPYDVGEMPGAVPVSLLIQHRGNVDDRLLGASSPVASRVEIHTSPLNYGVRQMLPVLEGITIPAAGTLILEPESTHLMLIGLREDLIQGRSFPLTLRFARAGEVTITVRVRRKVDAAGLTPIPPMTIGDLTISLASAPPAPAMESATPRAS